MEEKRYQKRKEKAWNDGNQDALASACTSLGNFYNQQGKYQNAVEEYMQVASIYQKLGKKLEMAKAHRMAGEMFMLLSEFENALDHVNKYLNIVQNLKNKVEEQRAHATLGRAYLLQGQSATDSAEGMGPLKNAEKSFIRSLLISKELSGQITKLEQLDMQARLYLNIGVVKEHMEEFEKSIEYIERAIKISKTHEMFELLHLCYVSMSLLYHCKKNDATLALKYTNLALQVAKRLPNKVKKICETLITKSEIVIREGDFYSAKQILTKAYKKNTPDENDRINIEKSLRIVVKVCQTLDALITTDSNDYSKRKELFEIVGDGCCHLQNYSKALEYYTQMLDCARSNNESGKDLIPIYVSLYQTYKDDKQYQKALEYLWMEYELNTDVPHEAFATLCTIGEVYELQMQPFWTIQDAYQKALLLARTENNSKLEKIAISRLRTVQEKFKMFALKEQLEDEAKTRGIDLDTIDDDSDSESASCEQNTPELGTDICLEDLTDSDSSDIDETEKPRPHRKRGNCLAIKKNNKGETQLHQACIDGNLELVRRLIDQGHVVNVRDHAGWLPLHEACNHGYRDIVELLLDKGASVAINDKGGTSCDGITPLYDACANGFLDVVELLLERGANPTVKTDYGDTCLNVLDKWRRKADICDGEHAQYTAIRDVLSVRLRKSGVADDSPPSTSRRRSLRSNNNRSTDSHELSAHALEEEDETILRTITLSSPVKSSNIGHEYRNLMESIKRPNRATGSSDESDYFPPHRKRSAFLDEDEVGDDWLYNDLAPDRKKKKMQRVPSPMLYNVSSNDSEDTDEVPIHLESPTLRKHPSKSMLPHTTSMSSNSNHTGMQLKRQISLLDSGFCRFRSDNSISCDDWIDKNANLEPDSTTQPAQSPQRPPLMATPTNEILHPPMIVPSTVSFKIKIEAELLLVPVDRRKLSELNIRWLAEEASRRYYNLIGLKPILRLKTADGFAFEESDPISVAIEETMITASVVEWKMSSLPQRYEEMCHQLQKKADSDVQSALEKGQISHSVVLNDFSLTSDLIEPVFKALYHQTNLRILDLSNNFIQNTGCKHLAKSLPTLNQLRILCLRGNCITSAGIDDLSNSGAVLDELEELNLSQNPLGNKSIRQLHKLVSGCKSLHKLQLSECGISNFYDFDLNFYQLTEFDVGFNNLSPECFRKLLTKLNSSRLHQLNLSFCLRLDKNCGPCIAGIFESGTCEKFKRIDLAGCHLCDGDIFLIMQSLKKASGLEVLNLSENPSLTALSVQYILEDSVGLQKLILTNCPEVIDLKRLDTYPTSKNFPSFISVTRNGGTEGRIQEEQLKEFWQRRYSSSGNVQSFGDHIVCYLDEKDLMLY